MFIITRQLTHSINHQTLDSRALLDELENNCDSILKQVKKRLFAHAAGFNVEHRLPPLNDFVDDYWKLRYRRTIQSWKSPGLPSVVTHNLVNDADDQVLNFVRNANLINKPEDRVKIVYHPDFISTTNPLFGMEYSDFVRGCHLGVFPSYYEPWGYTPIECLASGVSAVTSDLSGFGDYAKNEPMADEEHGLFVVDRVNKDFNSSADHLTQILLKYVKTSSRTRIAMRNKSEDLSEQFDWKNLYSNYENAYLAANSQLKTRA
jgi:glycogen(starch) synthase